VYGPPPVEYIRPQVISLYYIDSQSKKILLQNNQGVPVQLVCLIDFSKDINTTAPVSIAFIDAAGLAVPISKSWRNPMTLEVAPLSQLLFDTAYSCTVGDDAEDTFGNKIYFTPDATATFRTVSA
jgi:hypothetical protein